MAETIGASRGAAAKPAQAIFRAAHEAALASQRRFEDGLRAIGERALAWAREEGRPAVLIAGETHVLHEAGHQLGHPGAGGGQRGGARAGRLLPAAAGRAAAGQGALGERRQRPARRGGRRASRRRVPALLCAYGCGPTRSSSTSSTTCWRTTRTPCSRATGTEARPATSRACRRSCTRCVPTRRSAPPARRPPPTGRRCPGTGAGRAAGRIGAQRLARYETPLPSSLDGGGYRRYYFGHVGGSLGRQLVAAMRGSGLDAHYAGPADELALEEAGRHCTGKECLPYQLIWGSFARFLQAEPAWGRRRSA